MHSTHNDTRHKRPEAEHGEGRQRLHAAQIPRRFHRQQPSPG